MATSLRQVVLYVLIVHWTVVVAVVEEQKTHGDVEKHGNNNNVVQQTQDLTSLSKLITRSVCNGYDVRYLATRRPCGYSKAKAKQRCVMGVGMCLYAQLVQTKNKQCKSAIIIQ